MNNDKTLSCPRCTNLVHRVKLRKIKHPSGATLDVCDKCEGMWLDGSEVKLLYQHTNKNKKKNQSINNKKKKTSGGNLK
jgi:Zn-finger nucleic acid-binding protein